MNVDKAIFLINSNVRALLGVYEPDTPSVKSKRTLLKTFDGSIRVGDFVVVPSNTRHLITTMEIVQELDPEVDVDVAASEPCMWIIQRIDKSVFDEVTAQEGEAIAAMRRAQKREERLKLRDAMLAQSEDAIKKLPIYAKTIDGDATES